VKSELVDLEQNPLKAAAFISTEKDQIGFLETVRDAPTIS